MNTATRHLRLRGHALSAVLVVLTVLGVLWMHSVAVVSSPHEGMTSAAMSASVNTSGGHDSAHAGAADDESAAAQPMPCPSGHQMMHPCVGTTTAWPAVSGPTGVSAPPPVTDVVTARVMTVLGRAGRAPPWSVSSLDESVLLRV
ncbi:DUF6153 family protein [Rhodococcoides corynebacterioides]|uniref:DUF6153 family protein n=1 Tax=Rhodococcoides corynebacterioides TaxID=53972 RepID=UPI003F7D9D05